MDDSVQILGGNKSAMPTLPVRALGWCKDTGELYIGTAGGNKKIADTAIFGKVTSLEALPAKVTALETAMPGKLTASKAAAQTDISSTADLAAVIAAYNGLLAALRAAGIMKT